MVERAGPDAGLLALVRQWLEAASTSNARMRAVLDDLGLNDTTSGVLWILDPASPPVPMRELTRALGCDPSNTSLAGDKLERAGLARREPHPTDGRARVLRLTEAGQDLRAQLLDRLVETTPLASLTSAEQHQLRGLLAKVAAHR